jgi:RNA recognition motif-containing protein
LGFRTTADSLKAHFADCGSVRDVRIPYNDDGRPKGFAHVEFEDAAAA